MSTTTDPQPDPDTGQLSDELHELESHEAELERRTRSLELSGPLALIFSLFALALAVGALIVAISKDSGTKATSGGTSMPATMMGSTGAGPARTMMGAGGHGSFSSAQVDAAAKGTVYVQLGDYWAAPAVSSVRAGKVKFVAMNGGQVPHELMVERMPIKFDAPMQPNEDAAQGMIDDMDPGGTGRMTMHLRPGRYLLFCNITGHYAAGQHIPFTVTGS